MFKRIIIFSLFSFLIFSCETEKSAQIIFPREGDWRGVLHTQGQELPFNFTITQQEGLGLTVILKNGTEEIPIQNIQFNGDSIRIPMHIFDADLVATFTENEMRGFWRKNYAKNYTIPFTATYGKTHRFIEHSMDVNFNINGRWEVYFESATGKKLAVGEFKQNVNKVSGTFLRPAGDYRYLVGEMKGSNLYLSTFDGEHAYLFTGTVQGDKITGDFYSGQSRHETWTAERNAQIELPDRQTLTFLEEGYQTVDFKLPNMAGDPITLKDPRFLNKVIILQIFGTWCPNCMDETRFLSDWYNNNKDRGVEIIAISFEKKDDIDYARSRIEKLKERFNIQYTFLFGGKSNSESTSKAFPMLKGAVSFPTTVFIDRNGNVRKIHTGFSGPGTGEHYTRFIKDFNILMDELLEEQ